MVQNALQNFMTEKTQVIQIRVSLAEKEGFVEAATLAGIPLSSWVRERLRLTSIRELENAGRKIPFIEYLNEALTIGE
jgi:hypothetical protein